MTSNVTELLESSNKSRVKLSKDLKESTELLGKDQVRFLVDAYYEMQANRIRSKNQERALTESEEPTSVLSWLAQENFRLERQVKSALHHYSKSQPMGRWMMGITGVGPVLSAGLLAHIDIREAQTAGAIWRYAGLDPTSEWKKGEKRPWNASLKVLCWKLGESFVKVQNKDSDIYGKIYAKRKEQEIAKNEAGDFADQAAKKLEKYNIGRKTEAYKWYSKGKLPPAHIHQRACRYSVKLFLSHMHEVWYEFEVGTKPVAPYVFSLANHTHKIEPPPMVQ
jgi:hypothetical protein